jgi:hypothetical protein
VASLKANIFLPASHPRTCDEEALLEVARFGVSRIEISQHSGQTICLSSHCLFSALFQVSRLFPLSSHSLETPSPPTKTVMTLALEHDQIMILKGL